MGDPSEPSATETTVLASGSDTESVDVNGKEKDQDVKSDKTIDPLKNDKMQSASSMDTSDSSEKEEDNVTGTNTGTESSSIESNGTTKSHSDSEKSKSFSSSKDRKSHSGHKSKSSSSSSKDKDSKDRKSSSSHHSRSKSSSPSKDKLSKDSKTDHKSHSSSKSSKSDHKSSSSSSKDHKSLSSKSSKSEHRSKSSSSSKDSKTEPKSSSSKDSKADHKSKSSSKDSSDKKRKSDSSHHSSDAKKAKTSGQDFKKGTYKGVDGKFVYDGTILTSDEDVRVRDGFTEKIPKKNSDGALVFPDSPEFRPNLTPKEVLQAGSFGGTYFRPIKSSVTDLKYNKMWNELPQNWLEGLNIPRTISSTLYDEKVNTYKAKCGGSLEMWESSGWIDKVDPYGWFMWYCRFYLGRRCYDDDRQIGRWKNCCGPKGRWKGNLIGKIARAGVAYDNKGISPVVRQTLQHWGYRLTEKDYNIGKKRVKM